MARIVTTEQLSERITEFVREFGPCSMRKVLSAFRYPERYRVQWAVQWCLDNGRLETNLDLKLRARPKGLTPEQVRDRVIWYVNRFGPCTALDLTRGVRGALQSEIQVAMVECILAGKIEMLNNLKLVKAAPRKTRRK